MSRRWLFFFALFSGLSLGGYLAISQATLTTGFPLDDAWIHQTYARNLGRLGEWSFIPGVPSAGSTAPLWSALLAVGHALRINLFAWTFGLGWLLLCLTGMAGWALARRLVPSRRNWALAAGLLLLFEWRLVWAAGSGMETLLLAVIILAGLGACFQERIPSFSMGVLIGVGVWVRPDGLTLCGPALACLALQARPWKDRLRGVLALVFGISLGAVPYLVFNRLLAGAWWPNTFFAKQAEYAGLQQIPIWERYLSLGSLPLVGAGAVLLPGLVVLALQAARRRETPVLAAFAWLAGYVFIYAWRLPVTYQHGRYLIPAIPVYLLLALAGMARIARPDGSGMARRVFSRAWIMSAALALAVFWGLGARAYAQDVALIESEMVAAARWVAQHTPPEARIAAHDIGALGYFAPRSLLDLAGLVSPEVIPILRDEQALEKYLDRQGADYLVVFPGWYPYLSGLGSPVYSTGGRFSPAQGGENMVVYRWVRR